MQRNYFRTHFVESGRRLRVAGHRSFHLVSEGAARPFRREFPQTRKLYLKARRQIANITLDERRTAMSMELAGRVFSSATHTGDESVTPVSCRYNRSSGRIPYCAVRRRAG